MLIRQFIKDFRELPRIVKKMEFLTDAIVDHNGIGFLNLMFSNAGVPYKYRYLFFPEHEGEIFIDCGMNVGLITDIARKSGMEVYGFEPNPTAINLLNRKYKNDKLTHIYPYAVSNEEGEMNFYIKPEDGYFDQGASIIKEFAENHRNGIRIDNSIKVPVKKLTNIIKHDILTKHKKIHLLKIDIEGAEFGVINDIIDEGLYNNIKYIVVETHEKFFKNGKKMLNNLKEKIKKNNIDNIYLDRI